MKVLILGKNSQVGKSFPKKKKFYFFVKETSRYYKYKTIRK